MSHRLIYLISSILVIAVGLGAHLAYTGIALIDNDLGGALYAALAYLLLSMVWPQLPIGRKVVITLAAMLAIELFQLAPFLDAFAHSSNLALRALSFVFGTTWSWRDLLGYAAGIAVIALLDRAFLRYGP